MVTIKRLDLEKGVVKVWLKVGQTQSNLMDGPNTTGLDEINIQILVIGIEEYDNILVLMKFETN